MLIQFGAPRAAADALGLGKLHQQTFGDGPETVGFGQRDAGIVDDADEHSTFVERWQEGAREKGRPDPCRHNTSNDRGKYRSLMLERPGEQPSVARFEPAQQERVLRVMRTRRRQQVVGENRRHGDRGHQRG